MRAVVVHERGLGGDASVEDLAEPVPGPGEVLVAVRAVPVNYVDLLTLEGEYQFLPKLPYTPGKGPAGVVTAVGAGVTRFKPGEPVLAMAEYGGYAEAVCVDQHQAYRLPERMDFPIAAAMSLAYDTAWVALKERGRLSPGESVLVLGATGAVGGAAVQLARALGAGVVLAGTSTPVPDLPTPSVGVDCVVDLTLPGLRDELRSQVFEATGGRGVDIVIDPLGGDAFDAAIRAMAWRGRYVVVGFATGRIPTLKMNYPLLKNIEVSGLQVSDYRRRMPTLLEECYQEVFGLYSEGRIRVKAPTVYPLSRWKEALRAISVRGSGRIILDPAH